MAQNTYTLIRRYGEKVETQFSIMDGASCLSPHVFASEFGVRDEAGRWVENEPIIAYEPTLILFEALRMKIKKPIAINSGYRNVAKQTQLYNDDILRHNGKPSGEVAHPDHAPHTTGSAMDISIPKGYTAANIAKMIREISVQLGLPMARTGYVMYNYRFVHFDLVFMLYHPNTKIPNPCPSWIPGTTW
jgi:hypothetical protein